jgi:hypothetical protein
MSTINDGESAFPVTPAVGADGYPGVGQPYPECGMSLRDYFAIHGTQPGCSEVVAIAGLVWSAGKVWLSESVSITFDKWYDSLPLTERLDLCARVRYAQADAMLRAREAK